MDTSVKTIVLVATFLSLAAPLSAEWEVASPMENQLYIESSTIAALGKGDPDSTATIKIKYNVNGKWHEAYQADVPLRETGVWGENCNPLTPAGNWPTSEGPKPTPYRFELYEGKTLLKTIHFKVLRRSKKPTKP